MSSTSARPSGAPMALVAYLIWGLLPLYLMLVREVPPFEFVGWRIIFTVPICLLFIALRRQLPDLRAALADRKVLRNLLLSAVLIGANWLIYIAAIQAGHIFAASLGYYINPLVNVLTGTLFLRERLSPRQWIAVALAGAGVSILVWGALDMLWISLSLALTFSLYGLVRKVTPVGSLPGLTIESILLLLPGIGIMLWYAASPAGSSFGKDAGSSLLIAGSGIVTAVPLLLFAIAARRMDYSTLGFFQFLAPSIVFLLGLFVFHEPLRWVQLASFIVIWAAIGLFVWDLLARRKA
jgi:chloramphenicol-sensitive protein RarD